VRLARREVEVKLVQLDDRPCSAAVPVDAVGRAAAKTSTHREGSDAATTAARCDAPPLPVELTGRSVTVGLISERDRFAGRLEAVGMRDDRVKPRREPR
jgi:hypothetical protein